MKSMITDINGIYHPFDISLFVFPPCPSIQLWGAGLNSTLCLARQSGTSFRQLQLGKIMESKVLDILFFKEL